MVLFSQSDVELFEENIAILQNEKARLIVSLLKILMLFKEDLGQCKSKLEQSKNQIVEQNAELKLLRSEREQFIEMGVRLEI